MFLIKGLFMLAIIAIILLMLAPVIIKSVISKMIGKATNQQQQQYSNPFGESQSQSYSSTQADDVEEYHGSVLVHDEDSARRMRRMKADAEDVEAVIIDEPAKVREEEKVFR